jgi:hypothetical protein
LLPKGADTGMFHINENEIELAEKIDIYMSHWFHSEFHAFISCIPKRLIQLVKFLKSGNSKATFFFAAYFPYICFL